MKDIVLVVLILLTLGLSVLLIRFHEKALKADKKLEEERYTRVIAEEQVQKNNAKIASYEAQLKVATNRMERIEDILKQEKDVNEDLKRQYDKLSQTKNELEGKLQQAIDQAQTAMASAQEAAQNVAIQAAAATATVAPESQSETGTP